MKMLIIKIAQYYLLLITGVKYQMQGAYFLTQTRYSIYKEKKFNPIFEHQ